MNRQAAHKILEDREDSRTKLISQFIGRHPMSVVESLVIWSYIEDCPPDVRPFLRKLEPLLHYLEEYNEN